MDKNCKVCGESQANRPAIYRNEDYCCDLCRKVLGGEIDPKDFTMKTGKVFNPETGLYDHKFVWKLLEEKRNLQTKA